MDLGLDARERGCRVPRLGAGGGFRPLSGVAADCEAKVEDRGGEEGGSA